MASSITRLCANCDYKTQGNRKKAEQALANHQRTTGHFGERLSPSDPITEPMLVGRRI